MKRIVFIGCAWIVAVLVCAGAGYAATDYSLWTPDNDKVKFGADSDYNIRFNSTSGNFEFINAAGTVLFSMTAAGNITATGTVQSTASPFGTAAQRAAEDTLTNGANLPDGAAIVSYVAAAAQPIDTGLTDIAGLAVTDGNIIVGNGTNWVAESGATARMSLGLGTAAQRSAEDTLTNGSALPDGAAITTYVTGYAQPVDDDLSDIAALTPTENYFIVGDGRDWTAESGLGVFSILGLGSAAIRTAEDTLTNGANLPDGAAITAYVTGYAQPLDAGLTDVAGLAVTDGNIIVGDGDNWVAESGATARTSLGLGSAATRAAEDTLTNGSALPDGAAITAYVTGYAQPVDNDLTDIAALTPSDNYFIVGDGTDWTAESASTALLSIGAQPLSLSLIAIAGLTPDDGEVIIGNGTNWVAESGSTARTSLGFTSPILDKAAPGDIGGTTPGTVKTDELIVDGATIDRTEANGVNTWADGTSDIFKHTITRPSSTGYWDLFRWDVSAWESVLRIDTTGLMTLYRPDGGPTLGFRYDRVIAAGDNLDIQTSGAYDIVLAPNAVTCLTLDDSTNAGTFAGDVNVSGGDLAVGVSGTQKGTLDLKSGSGIDPSVIKIADGTTTYYVWTTDTGTVRIGTSAPTAANAATTGMLVGPQRDALTFVADDTTPDVTAGKCWTVPGTWTDLNDVTALDNPVPGETYTIVGGDADCDFIDDNSALDLNGNWTATSGAYLLLQCVGTNTVKEIKRW